MALGYTYLPGHGPASQPPDELTSPLQVFPPYAGVGFVQLLDLECVPEVQLTEHAPQEPQPAHPPWTANKNGR